MAEKDAQVTLTSTGTTLEASDFIRVGGAQWFDVSIDIGAGGEVQMERREALPDNSGTWGAFKNYIADTEEKGRNATNMDVRANIIAHTAGTMIIRIRKGNS